MLKMKLLIAGIAIVAVTATSCSSKIVAGDSTASSTDGRTPDITNNNGSSATQQASLKKEVADERGKVEHNVMMTDKPQ